MRKIVFVGNCQGRRLQQLYRDDLAYLTGDTTEFLVSYLPMTDADRQILRSADVIVAQAIDSEHPVDITQVDTSAEVILFPNIAGVFLWPLSGVVHTCHQKLPDFWQGAYGTWFGDRWLNRKLEAGVPPADIVNEYLDLDIAKVVNLDRLYELHIDRARQRDVRTGFDITTHLERRLAEEPLFVNSSTLEVPLFRQLAIGVFERLGAPMTEIERTLNSFLHTPFHADYAPIHPSVARHFGLKFITPQTRYQTWTGERQTFVEWIEAYVRSEWNDPLLKAIATASAIRRYDAEAEATLQLIQKGLETSPASVKGLTSLAHLLLLKGDTTAAFETFVRLDELDRTLPGASVNIAHILAERGELAEAEQRILDVTSRWPRFADAWARLARIRGLRGDGPGAVTAIEQSVALEPRNVHLLTQYVGVIERFAPAKDPFQALNNAIALDPRNASLLAALARAEAESGHFNDALTHIEHAIQLEPDNTELATQKASILVRSGDPVAAEATLAEAVELEPENSRLHETSAVLLMRIGRHKEATAAAQRAVALDPKLAPLFGQLAGQLSQLGDFANAEQMYRCAIERDWNNVELLEGLGQASQQQGNFVGTVLAFHRAVQLRPHEPRFHRRMAGIMIDRGDLPGAEEALAKAISLEPANAESLGLRALVFLRRGDLAAALEAVEAAVAINPEDPHLAMRRAHILSELGDYAAAERVLQDAIAVSPSSSGFHAMLGNLLLRQQRQDDAKMAFQEALRYEPHHAGYQSQLEKLTADEVVL